MPKPITDGLRQRSVDVLTAQAFAPRDSGRGEDNRKGTPDPILLDRATKLQRVMFSQDEDFLAEASRRQQQNVNFSGVIYAHQQNITMGDCIRDLEIIAKASDPEDLANRVQYLPL